MKQKVNGNTGGVREVVLREMESIYALTQPQDVFLSAELCDALARYTGLIGREILVYISRSGGIEEVRIGDDHTVSMPEMRLVRNTDRLCGVRCIHTHPRGSGLLSDVDMGSLSSLRLDAMAAIGVTEDGRPTTVCVAYLGAMEGETRQTVVYGPMRAHHLPQKELIDAIYTADAHFQTGAYAVTQARPDRAILVGIENAEGYDTLEELAALAETAGVQVVGREQQRRRAVDTATYIGTGKAEELALSVNALEADLVIFDDELSAIQMRNLEQVLGVPIIDRTMLILDIFALRAQSREGKLQVELAQLKYRLPRLLGMGRVLSRQGASGVGMRGPGEKKLEIDRRRIRRRVFELEQELAEIGKQRGLRRERRMSSAVPAVALVGYTNAGKSTLLNRLSGSDVLAEDQLFATLDPRGAPGRAAVGGGVPAVRYGGVYQQAAARTGARVPLHTGGGQKRGAHPARDRCDQRLCGRADARGGRCPCAAGRGGYALYQRVQQGGRPVGAAAHAGRRGVHQRAHRRGRGDAFAAPGAGALECAGTRGADRPI